jgi:hypothetical protein
MTPSRGLSFVAFRDGNTLPLPKGDELPRCFWHVKPTGDCWADEAAGDKLALEYLEFQAQPGEMPFLQMIVRDMPRKLTGIEIGFLSTVAHAACSGVQSARNLVAHYERCRNAMLLKSPSGRITR